MSSAEIPVYERLESTLKTVPKPKIAQMPPFANPESGAKYMHSVLTTNPHWRRLDKVTEIEGKIPFELNNLGSVIDQRLVVKAESKDRQPVFILGPYAQNGNSFPNFVGNWGTSGEYAPKTVSQANYVLLTTQHAPCDVLRDPATGNNIAMMRAMKGTDRLLDDACHHLLGKDMPKDFVLTSMQMLNDSYYRYRAQYAEAKTDEAKSAVVAAFRRDHCESSYVQNKLYGATADGKKVKKGVVQGSGYYSAITKIFNVPKASADGKAPKEPEEPEDPLIKPYWKEACATEKAKVRYQRLPIYLARIDGFKVHFDLVTGTEYHSRDFRLPGLVVASAVTISIKLEHKDTKKIQLQVFAKTLYVFGFPEIPPPNTLIPSYECDVEDAEIRALLEKRKAVEATPAPEEAPAKKPHANEAQHRFDIPRLEEEEEEQILADFDPSADN